MFEEYKARQALKTFARDVGQTRADIFSSYQDDVAYDVSEEEVHYSHVVNFGRWKRRRIILVLAVLTACFFSCSMRALFRNSDPWVQFQGFPNAHADFP